MEDVVQLSVRGEEPLPRVRPADCLSVLLWDLILGLLITKLATRISRV